MPRLASDCTSVWCSILSITGTSYTLSAVFLSSPCHQRKGETYHFDAVYWVFCKNNFMMNFKGGKKCRGGFKSSVNGRQIFDMLPKPSALG